MDKMPVWCNEALQRSMFLIMYLFYGKHTDVDTFVGKIEFVGLLKSDEIAGVSCLHSFVVD